MTVGYETSSSDDQVTSLGVEMKAKNIENSRLNDKPVMERDAIPKIHQVKPTSSHEYCTQVSSMIFNLLSIIEVFVIPDDFSI